MKDEMLFLSTLLLGLLVLSCDMFSRESKHENGIDRPPGSLDSNSTHEIYTLGADSKSVYFLNIRTGDTRLVDLSQAGLHFPAPTDIFPSSDSKRIYAVAGGGDHPRPGIAVLNTRGNLLGWLEGTEDFDIVTLHSYLQEGSSIYAIASKAEKGKGFAATKWYALALDAGNGHLLKKILLQHKVLPYHPQMLSVSPDGHLAAVVVAYYDPDSVGEDNMRLNFGMSQAVGIIDLKSGSFIDELPIARMLGRPVFTHDSRAVMLVSYHDRGVYHLDLSSMKVSRLFSHPSTDSTGPYEAGLVPYSHNGQSLVLFYRKTAEGYTEIRVINSRGITERQLELDFSSRYASICGGKAYFREFSQSSTPRPSTYKKGQAGSFVPERFFELNLSSFQHESTVEVNLPPGAFDFSMFRFVRACEEE